MTQFRKVVDANYPPVLRSKRRMLDASSSRSATHNCLLLIDFLTSINRSKAPELIERFALRHPPLVRFRETFRGVRRAISPNSPLASLVVRLRDAEMQRAQILVASRLRGRASLLDAGSRFNSDVRFVPEAEITSYSDMNPSQGVSASHAETRFGSFAVHHTRNLVIMFLSNPPLSARTRLSFSFNRVFAARYVIEAFRDRALRL